jgi:hypothetical protein
MKTIIIIFVIVVVGGVILFYSGTLGFNLFAPAAQPTSTALVIQVPAVPMATSTATTTDNLNWINATTSTGLLFSYPNPFPLTYVTPVDWPPAVSRTKGSLNCTKNSETTMSGAVTSSSTKILNGREYCVFMSSEGAAGSTFTAYEYATAQGASVARVSFTLRTSQCMNYDKPKQSVCKKEQAEFNVDALADQILQSVTVQ